jgi:hypothetical protein
LGYHSIFLTKKIQAMNKHEQMLGSALNVAQKMSIRKGQVVGKAQPDELILIKPLDTATSEYEFQFNDEIVRNDSPIAKGLQFRNNFVISGVAVGVLKVPLNGSTVLWGSSHAIYHADPNTFNIAAGGSSLSEAQAIEGVYNGTMTLKTNEGIKVDKMPLRGFRTVHQTQVGGTTDGTTGFSTANQQLGDEVKSLGAIVKIAGGNENSITVRVQTVDKTHLAGDANSKNYLYIVLRGAVIKGGTIAELQGK